MNKIKLGKDTLILAILTLLTVLVWIGFDVYKALSKTKIPRILQDQLSLLDPKLPMTTFEELEKRISFSQEELNKAIAPVVKETEEKSEEKRKAVTTDSGQTATESGTLD